MKKIIVLSLIVLLNSINIYAYKVGEVVNENIASKIKLDNKITIVDFFASWCVSCKHELPLVNKLSKELQDVNFIGIDTDEEVSEGIAFQKELGLEFFVFNDDKQEVIQAFNPIGMPAIYYIKDKKILKVRFGAIDSIDKVIKEDLKSFK